MRTLHFSTRRLLIAVLSAVTLLLLVPTIINALWQQFTLLAFSRLLFSLFPLMAVGMPLVTLFALLQQDRLYVRRELAMTSLAFLGYVCLVAAFHLSELKFSYIFTGYAVFFYFMFLLVPVSFVAGFLPYRMMRWGLLWATAGCSVVGILQYVLNRPLLRVGDSTGDFQVLSWLFLEANPPHVRGFSFFNSGLEFGIFLTFAVGVVVAYARRRWSLGLLILALVLAATFCTLTRNVYLGVGLALLGSLAYQFVRDRRLLLVLPLLSLGAGYLVSGGLSSVVSGGLASTETLDTRSRYWQQEIVRQYRRDTVKLLFGEGYYQSGNERSGSRIFVDNTYLQLVAHVGLIGLLLFLAVYISLLRYAVRGPRHALRSGLYGFLVAWPAIAIFNIAVHHVALFALLPLLTAERIPQERQRSLTYD